MPDKQLKVSFCITCKGRGHHLKETLRQNIENNKDYPNTEFVILDYDSKDGLGDWVKQNFEAEISSGKIRYARTEDQPYFRMAHAKNMAHRVATGDILCNLDADNMTGKGFAKWLNQQFSQNPDVYVRPHKKTLLARRLMLDAQRGSLGRIAISRSNFMALHGYDERYEGWGNDDSNFDSRAHLAGFKRIDLPYTLLGSTIQHTDSDRVENLGPEARQKSEQSLGRLTGFTGHMRKFAEFDGRLTETPPDANPDGNFGCGKVTINFKEDLTLEPFRGTAIKLNSGAISQHRWGFTR